jgi:hypothetical protein
MKKLLILLAFLTTLTFSQSRVMWVDFGTLANSVTETAYATLGNWAKIDSISVMAVATGETDVDSIDIYVGFANSNTAGVSQTPGWYSATAYTFVSTVDVAVGVKVFQNVTVANATLLTGVVLRGVNSLKIVTRGATAGNDPTDPNKFLVGLQIWGTQ